MRITFAWVRTGRPSSSPSAFALRLAVFVSSTELPGHERVIAVLRDESETALGGGGANNGRERLLHRVGQGRAVVQVEELPMVGYVLLGPQALHHLQPFLGVFVAEGLKVFGIEPHLLVLGPVRGAHDVQHQPSVANIVESGGHLGKDSRVDEGRRDRGDQTGPLGVRSEPSGQHHRLNGMVPEAGGATDPRHLHIEKM